MPCATNNDVAALLDGDISSRQRDALLSHAGGCDPCRELLSSVAATLSSSGHDDERFGRYRLVEIIGRGAMGTVFRAHDPELERDVAIKILRSKGELGDQLTERLRREARAMARLSHPNVVQIHDVGEVDGELFLAMELVEGETLRQWLEREERSLGAIASIFADAARGLQSIHEAGLVHRDVKPDNILIGRDGRVRLSDFGLVRDAEMVTRASGSLSPSLVTRRGAVVGTPAYMAPEQLEGGVVDGQSDQFALCASLYEALAGRRAFDASSARERLASIRSGPPPLPASVPRRLRRALQRGLAEAPEERLPSVAHLEAALDNRPLSRWIAAATVLCIALGALLWAAWPSSPPSAFEEFERSTDQRIADVNRRVRGLSARFAALDIDSHRELADDIGATVSRVTESWRDLRVQTWVATHVEHQQSEELFDRTMLCLEDRLSELEAALRAIDSSGVAREVTSAVAALRGLPSIDRCGDEARLLAARPPPASPDEARAYQDLRRELARARIQHEAGQLDPAVLDDLGSRVEELGHPLPRAMTAGLLAAVARREGRLEEARSFYGQAIQLAAEGRDHTAVATYWTRLLLVVGNEQNLFDEARTLEPAARAAVAQAGAGPLLVAELHQALGTLAYGEGHNQAARGLFEKARSVLVASPGVDPMHIARVDVSLGRIAIELGDLDFAERTLHDALTSTQKQHGDLHPLAVKLLTNLALAHEQKQAWSEARRCHERIIELSRQLYGADNLRKAEALRGLSVVSRHLGEHDESVAHAHEAVDLHTRILGADDLSTVAARATYANALHGAGRHAEAVGEWRETLAGAAAVLPPDHPQLARLEGNLAHVYLAQKRYDQALETFDNVAGILESSGAAVAADIELARVECLIELGRPAEARRIWRPVADDLAAEHPLRGWAEELGERL